MENIKPLKALTSQEINKIKYILTDVDDTLTLDGKLPPATLQALSDLQQAGIKVVAVTGACAGWCDQMVKLWPLSAVIGENGAFWMKKSNKGFETYYSIEQQQMQEQQRVLLANLTLIVERYPDVCFAQDQPFRFCDVAIDIAQNRPRLDEHIIDELLTEIRSLSIDGQPVKATLSSIHINVWLGDHSKKVSSELFLKHKEDYQHTQQALYIGDSLNDESMFEWLETTVGVANIEPYLDQLEYKPAYITQSVAADGFVEFSQHFLKCRNV